MFNPSRFCVARKRRKLNKAQLAQLSGLESRTISAYENGEFEPSPETLARLASILRFDIGFFAGSDLHHPSAQTASFRSLARMSASNRDAALSFSSFAFLLSDWLEKQFTLPDVDVPDLREEDPESAADSLRQHWALGERPIRNMVHLLESKGVRVFSMAEDTEEIDAYSLWRGTVPFVFLNTRKSAERSRFDAAHELGHLVLHRHAECQGKDAENQANQFASSFLMPRGSVLAHVPVLATLNSLIKLKKIWNVSLASITYRLHALGAISDWHHRSLVIEIGQRGYRTNEPDGSPREMSMVLAKTFEMLRKDGITKNMIAKELFIDPDELDKMVFGLILNSLEGSGTRTQSFKKPDLRIVK